MNNLGKNKKLLLAKYPNGLAELDDFIAEEVEVPNIVDNELLIQSHYVGVDAALRLIVRDSDEFLFRVQPGDIIHANIAGEVIASNNKDFEVGDFVTGALGVQSLSISNGEGLEKCDPNQSPLGSWLGGFGVSGLTAYFALFDECKPQPGETVLVTGAAGAVGSMAGQFAKLAGAKVIGTTSSKEKCDWLINELGYDVAINYNDENWYEQLEAAAPDRLNIIFDNTGGSVMNEALKLIAMHGVVLLCGSTSQYYQDEMSGPSNYIWLGSMRARLQGFVIFDYAERYAEARKNISQWIDNGSLKLPEFVCDGDIEDFPSAFKKLFEGKNFGKMLLKLPAAK